MVKWFRLFCSVIWITTSALCTYKTRRTCCRIDSCLPRVKFRHWMRAHCACPRLHQSKIFNIISFGKRTSSINVSFISNDKTFYLTYTILETVNDKTFYLTYTILETVNLHDICTRNFDALFGWQTYSLNKIALVPTRG